MNIEYEKFQKINNNTIEQILNIIHDSFDKYVGKDYSQEGIETFYKFANKQNLSEMIEKNEIIIIAKHEDNVAGIIATRNKKHISLLFVDEKYHKNGIAKKLVFLLKKEIIKNSKNEIEITVNSSPFAEKIYEKIGFEKAEEIQEKNGIKYIPMKLKINENLSEKF